MTLYLTADFQEKESTRAAIQELKTTGFSPDDLAVFSDEPVEFPRGVLDRPSHMSLAVVTGALTFCLLAIAFVYFTQYNYRLITGGMPVFSFWATGVVFYELTMFGAILITFVWFLRESGLVRRGPREPVPQVEPDVICLRVRCSSDRTGDVNRLLSSAGGANLRELGSYA
jgi:hypothetical protein